MKNLVNGREGLPIPPTHRKRSICLKSLGLTQAFRQRTGLECRQDVGVFLRSPTNGDDNPNGVEAASPVDTHAPRLVLIEAASLDDAIDHPPLIEPAPRHRPTNSVGLRNGSRGDCGGQRGLPHPLWWRQGYQL
jgi:hypothetical protein